jgi:cell division protein FtsZ
LNVLDRISLDRMMESSLVSMHTDVRVLSQAMASVKIQLGADIMRGIGSGGDPELGREAAASSREHIKAALQGHDMVFICVGLGGGTGSGATPVVAEIAKETGAMVFVFATMPFPFEGRRRLRQAEVALEEVQKHSDGLILFENSRMGELILPKEGIQKAFSQADQLIGHSVRAVSSMVAQPGIVRISMADLSTALRSQNSRCLFGFGEARGTNRVTEALKRALKSPLVNQGLLLQNTRNLLVHVAGGEGLALSEVEVLMKNVGKYVPDQTQILFGLTVDAKLGDTLAVTLLSSLSAQEMALESAASALDRIAAAGHTPVEDVKSPRSAVVDVPALNGTGAAKLPASKPAIAPPPAAEGDVLPIADLFAPAPVVRASAPPLPPVAELAPVIASVVAEVQMPQPVAAPIQPPVAIIQEVVAPVAPPVQPPVSVVHEMVAPVVHVAPPAPIAAPISVPVAEVAPAPQPIAAPLVQQAPPEPAPTSSVFAVIDDDDELEDEEMEEAAPWQTTPAPIVESKSFTASIVASSQHVESPAPIPNERRVHRDEPAQPEPHVFDTVKANAQAKAGPKIDYQQASFNLTPEEVARFKGTEKIFHEGDDLDIPTWMRAKQKLKG